MAVLLENAYLTDMRTAAARALASMLLCVDKAEAGAEPTLAILGAGVQARLHARSVTSAMPGFFSSIVLWARDAAKGTAAAESLQAELGEAIAVSSASTVEQAVRRGLREPPMVTHAILDGATFVDVEGWPVAERDARPVLQLVQSHL